MWGEEGGLESVGGAIPGARGGQKQGHPAPASLSIGVHTQVPGEAVPICHSRELPAVKFFPNQARLVYRPPVGHLQQEQVFNKGTLGNC